MSPASSKSVTNYPDSGGAVAALPRGVQLDGLPEREAVDVRPEDVGEHHLGVRRLPQHEVGQPLLAGGAPHEVGVGELGDVEVARKSPLVDAVRVEAAGGGLASDGACCVRELRTA